MAEDTRLRVPGEISGVSIMEGTFLTSQRVNNQNYVTPEYHHWAAFYKKQLQGRGRVSRQQTHLE